MEREIETAGMAQPIDPRHPDLAAPLDVTEREVVGGVPLVGQPLRVLRSTGHVAASGEPSIGTGEADRIEFGLRVGPDRRPLERPIHVLSEGVASIGAIDPQMQRATPHLGADERRPELGYLDRSHHQMP